MRQANSFQLKADMMPLTVLKLQKTNLDSIRQQLQQTIESAPKYFEQAPVVIDVAAIAKEISTLDLCGLYDILKTAQIVPVGIKGLPEELHAQALSEGLTPLYNSKPAEKKEAPSANKPSTKVITKPVRAGTQVYAQDGDLLILAAVNSGAEVIADGHIHIYGPLRGRALAGARGDSEANIFCQACDAELISIAGVYFIKDNIPAIKTKKSMIRIFLNQQQINLEGI